MDVRMMSEIMEVPLPRACSRRLMSFLTFHISMFFSASFACCCSLMLAGLLLCELGGIKGCGAACQSIFKHFFPGLRRGPRDGRTSAGGCRASGNDAGRTARSNSRNKYLQALRREWVGGRGRTVSRSHVEFAVKGGRCWEAAAAFSGLRVNVRCVTGQVALSCRARACLRLGAARLCLLTNEHCACNISVILQRIF